MITLRIPQSAAQALLAALRASDDGSIHTRLTDFLADVLSVYSVQEQMTLVQTTAANVVENDVVWGGSQVAFFSGLLSVLADYNSGRLVRFLQDVRANTFLGEEDAERIREFVAEIENMPDYRLREAFGGRQNEQDR